MLEINPNYVNSSPEDDLNTIDGRYIDLVTGLFIDITTVRPIEGASRRLMCKDTHEYDVRGSRYDDNLSNGWLTGRFSRKEISSHYEIASLRTSQ